LFHFNQTHPFGLIVSAALLPEETPAVPSPPRHGAVMAGWCPMSAL